MNVERSSYSEFSRSMPNSKSLKIDLIRFTRLILTAKMKPRMSQERVLDWRKKTSIMRK